MGSLSQHQQHMAAFVAYLVKNNRDEVMALLNQSGRFMVNPSDQQITKAVYEQIQVSKAFGEGLRNLMRRVASTLKANGTGINRFVIGRGASMRGASGEHENLPSHGGGTGAANITPTTKTTTKKAFADTGVGSFLSNLFSSENVNKYIDTGIGIMKTKQDQKTMQQQIDLANAQAAAMYGQGAGAAVAQGPAASNSWVLPVVIGVVVVGVIVTIMVMANRKK